MPDRITKLFLTSTLVSIIASTALFAGAPPPWEGDFSWSNTGKESEYGNVNQSVQLSLKSVGENVDVGIVIAWQAGARVELGTSLKVADIVSQTDTQGRPEYVLRFDFRDPFQNKGTGKIVVNGQTAKLSIDATEVVDNRAARQYGDYVLTRSTAP